MEDVIEIHVFHCGQGDTLLLHLGRQYWILVDCHLPTDAAVEAFIERLTELGVRRLDGIYLSHPDRDHYSGMRQLLEHFTTGERSVGMFCDTGFAWKLFETADSAEDELFSLYRRMVDLCDGKNPKLAYNPVCADLYPAEDTPFPIRQLIAISAMNSDIQLANIKAVIGANPRSPNELSLVFVAVNSGERIDFHGLFTGDAGGKTLGLALERFSRSSHPKGKPLTFDFVKVAHHGSSRSHDSSPTVAAIRVPHKSVAVVSTSSRSARLPRREVLKAYLDAGWNLYDTGRRSELTEANRLAHAVAWIEGTETKCDIVVSWSQREGVSAVPEHARVYEEHLRYYPRSSAE